MKYCVDACRQSGCDCGCERPGAVVMIAKVWTSGKWIKLCGGLAVIDRTVRRPTYWRPPMHLVVELQVATTLCIQNDCGSPALHTHYFRSLEQKQ